MNIGKIMIDISKLKRICAVYLIFWSEQLKCFQCEICFRKWEDISAQIAREHWKKHKGI